MPHPHPCRHEHQHQHQHQHQHLCCTGAVTRCMFSVTGPSRIFPARCSTTATQYREKSRLVVSLARDVTSRTSGESATTTADTRTQTTTPPAVSTPPGQVNAMTRNPAKSHYKTNVTQPRHVLYACWTRWYIPTAPTSAARLRTSARPWAGA